MPAHKKREITNVSLQDFVGPVWCSSERHSPKTWAMKKRSWIAKDFICINFFPNPIFLADSATVFVNNKQGLYNKCRYILLFEQRVFEQQI